uniref:protein disulfide-isomerase n=1 Tax=Cyclopterus lumpus TaxID=8103 RepID=A0A8C3A9T9_CYCLU
MRTHTLLTVALLGLLLWASCGQAKDTTQGDSLEETEETPGEQAAEEETEKTVEENNVMVLHNTNFDRALSENQYLLVKFYVPWCGHCKTLEPIYAEVAGKLKEDGSPMRLAQVEATKEQELSLEFKIMGYPILKLFTNGDRKKPIDYPGPRTVEAMLQWIKRCTGPGAPVLDTADSAAQFIESHKIAVIGFFDNLESEAVKVFKTVVLALSDTEFAMTTSPEVFQKYGVENNSVVLFKKMLFVLIDTATTVANVLNYFGVSDKDVPTARLVSMETGKKFNTEGGDLAIKSLRRLCQDVVDGTAEPYFKSEEIPEDWNKEPVKVLVGKNFASVALDPTKNVFVEFYAPWCQHCKDLAPIWEQLGEKYADRDDIIIAKLDSTANEVESLPISAFPTLKYFPADEKQVVDYSGKKDLESLSKFLDDGGVLPEAETSEEGDDDVKQK